jgi:D-glycero-D-manno-heptose 1,7-bisphosphate phosphatase
VAVSTPAVFLDKDGTLVDDVPYNVDPRLIRLAPGAGDALARLAVAGYRLVVVSNQSGVARGLFDETLLTAVETELRSSLASHGVELDGVAFCPHLPGGTVEAYAIECDCRKPKPGLLRQMAERLDLDLAGSWMVGDILDDVEAGRAAGCRTILVDVGNETFWELGETRVPHLIVADLPAAVDAILAAGRRRPSAPRGAGAALP